LNVRFRQSGHSTFPTFLPRQQGNCPTYDSELFWYVLKVKQEPLADGVRLRKAGFGLLCVLGFASDRLVA